MGKTVAFLLTGLAMVLSLTTWFSATAVLPELVQQFSLSDSQAAWLTNAVQLGFALGALSSSLMALGDIWPLTRFMTVSAVFAGLANALLLVDVGATGLILARFATGVALAGVYPPAMKFIATWFLKGRGFAMGAMVGALTLGSSMPHLVRAIGGSVSWEAVVLTCSLSALIAAAIFGLLLKEGPHAFSRTTVDLRQIAEIFRNKPVMLANLGYFGHMWELYAMWGWLLAFVNSASAHGLPLANVSALTFAVIAMGAPGCVFGGWLADRVGRCHTTMLMMTVSGSCAFLIGVFFGGPFWLFALIALVWGFTIVADSAQFSAAVTELSDTRLVGSSLAFQMGVGFGITILTIWLTPIVADTLGSWRWTFVMLVPGPVIGVLAMWRLRQMPQSQKMAQGKQ